MLHVVDPFQCELPVEYVGKSRRHHFSFITQDVGPHLIDLRCGCDTVVGGPFTCNVYDASRVRILNATECTDIGDDVEFTGIETNASSTKYSVRAVQSNQHFHVLSK